MIYKILREDEYMDFVVDGQTKGAPIDIKDKYIHFSTKEQLKGTLDKHFDGEDVLHLLAVDERKLENLKWEESRGGQLFPHLYGILSMGDVVKTWELDEHNRLPRDL